jgi:uncharacterized hydrophobic protein (TIGR00271 family)
MSGRWRRAILPEAQRRTLEELTEDLDLRHGDVRSKQTAFWTLLVLSSVIASAGVLSDSTATVIGAMIIAPLSTPIMGIALSITKRRRNGSLVMTLGGVVVVVLIGGAFSYLVPSGIDLQANPQIAGRTAPGALDMIAALATGLAGSIAMARRDVAAVLPGVAISISLVPPLAVVGICLGRGESGMAIGASALFLSNLLSMVLAGALVFAVLGYSTAVATGPTGSRVRSYVVVGGMLFLLGLPLVGHSIATFVLTTYQARAEDAVGEWLSNKSGATVTGSQYDGLTIVVSVRAPGRLPPTAQLRQLAEDVPDLFGITVETTVTDVTAVRTSSLDDGG